MSDMLQDLRSHFREVAQTRLAEMSALLDVLEKDPADITSLQQLARHFHALSGLGATYGYPAISQLGDEGETTIHPLVQADGRPWPDLLERWRSLVASSRMELEGPGAEIVLPGAAAKILFDVLLVESDAELAAELESVLTEEGMTVRVCATRVEALDLIGESMPDAIIVDIVLPDGPGYDVIEAIRARDTGHAAGAIMISAGHDFIEKVRAIRSGADAFIGKPVDIASIVRRVIAFRDRKERPPSRILAVEDDPVQAALLRRVLGSAGYDVTVCADPAQFESVLTGFAPDLLLMDVQLADYDVTGYDLVRYLRQSDGFSTLPVIFVTGETERKAMIDSAHSGGDLTLPKPVDWDLLLTQIASALQRSTRVRELTDRDPLTGVLTRGAFESRARHRIEGNRRLRARDAALVLLDLDRFKEVNDTWGHVAGDRVLARLGAMLRRRLRQTDVVGRYGGEEFAMILDDISLEDATRLMERMLEEFRRIDQGPVGPVTFSAGVTPLVLSWDASFRRADAALYEAKRSGRARVVAA